MKERGFTSWVKRPPALSSVSIRVHLWFFLLQLPDLGSRLGQLRETNPPPDNRGEGMAATC